jgi:hypothetical protein
MHNPFRHNRRDERATRSVAQEQRGYEGDGGRPVRTENEGAREATREPVGPGPVVGRKGEPVAAREPRRRTLGWRGRNAGAAAVGAVGGGALLLARLIVTVAGLIALLIALAIVLRDVSANSSNTIVEGIHEGANFFAGSFTGLITFSDKPKLELTVDWGIALAVYLIVGAVIAGAIRNIGLGGIRFEQRHRPAL